MVLMEREMIMYKVLMIATLLISSPIWAQDISLEPLLNKITLQLHAEQWLTTKTALVDVGINAAVSDQGIEKIQNQVMQKLSQFSSNAEWHIISFDRQLDKSGLETIQITAQARLQQSELGNLRDKAKSISKPGETYTIDNVQFVPSEEEIRQANNLIRANIYQQAKAEIDAINKTYPDQKYYLHQIDFTTTNPIVPMPARNSFVKVAGAGAPAPRMSLAVGNKAEVTAFVVFASLPDQVAQKLIPTKP